MNGTRDGGLDAMRGLAMLAVLFGHALELFFRARPDGGFDAGAFALYRTIYAFHMPAFFVISGMAAARSTDGGLKKVLTGALMLLLFADATHLAALPLAALARPELSPRALLAIGVMPLLTGSWYSLVVTWFLTALAFVQLLAWLHRRLGIAGRILIWSVLALAFWFARAAALPLFMCQVWGFGLLFFLCGRAAADSPHLHFKAPRPALLAAGLALLLLTSWGARLNTGCLFDPAGACNAPVSLLDGQVGFLPLFLLFAATGSAALVCLARAAEGTGLLAPLAWVGRHTLTLLVVNGAVLEYLQRPLLAGLVPAGPPLLALGLAAGLSLAQLAAIPPLSPVIAALQAFCRLTAGKIAAFCLPATDDREAKAF